MGSGAVSADGSIFGSKPRSRTMREYAEMSLVVTARLAHHEAASAVSSLNIFLYRERADPAGTKEEMRRESLTRIKKRLQTALQHVSNALGKEAVL